MMCGGHGRCQMDVGRITLNAERLVALGGMYHWTALTLLTVGMVQCGSSVSVGTWFAWGDFKQPSQPCVADVLHQARFGRGTM